MPVQMTPGLQNDLSLQTQNLGGPGPIDINSAIDAAGNIQTLNQLRNQMTDYIRLRLGDGIVDVELDKEHFELAIKQSLTKYRQLASNAQEESYAFLDLLPETQEYILPNNIMDVRTIFRRGIGSVTGTTASQFEPFASGYLNTYMLVAGRVGGLTNYEMFTQYQKLAMTMFGGYMNYTFNRVTKKLTVVRKIPQYGHTFLPIQSIVASSQNVGATITITFNVPWPLQAGNSIYIINPTVAGWAGQYIVQTVGAGGNVITVTAQQPLGSLELTDYAMSQTQIWSPELDSVDNTESVLLWVYNYKPDSVLLSDQFVYPWLQEYALAFCKTILGQARGKFAQIAGPQGGTQLNGAALMAEGQAEMEKLELDIRNYVDGSQPLTWVTG